MLLVGSRRPGVLIIHISLPRYASPHPAGTQSSPACRLVQMALPVWNLAFPGRCYGTVQDSRRWLSPRNRLKHSMDVVS